MRMAERNGLHWMDGIFVFLIALTFCPSATPRSLYSSEDEPSVNYSGYKVIRVHPVTEQQRNLFQVYFDQDFESGVTLWTEPMRPDHSMDFQVTSDALTTFLTMLHAQNVSYDFLIDDLQRLIEEQKRDSDEYRRGLEEKRRRRRSIRLVIQRSEGPPRGPTTTTPFPTTTTDQIMLEEGEGSENDTEDLAEITSRYATYSEITDWLRLVNRLNPDITELKEIGTSYNGKPMMLIKIGQVRNGSKPELWIDGGIHAREWISPATAIFIIHTLVTNYNEDPVISDLLEEFDWYILPVMNPDGYEYSHTTDRMWRKTRSRIPVHRRQCVGVDANRNFDFRWQSECDSNPRCAGRAPCQGVYSGSRPFSEPETIAVANFLLQHKDRMKMYLSLHSYSQLWLIPWAYTRQHPTDYDQLVRLSQKAVNSLKSWYNTTYSIGSPAEILYPATGGSYDWAKGVAGIKYSFTMELRDTGNYGFLLPRDQILPTGLETWAAINKTVAEIRQDTCWMSKTNC